VRGGKPETAQDRGGAGGRRMGVDVDKPGLDFGDPVRIMGGGGFPQQRGGIVMAPLAVGNSPRIAANSVDLPTPLRPTKPTRAPGTICAEPCSIRSRPAIRTEISVSESMRRCHR